MLLQRRLRGSTRREVAAALLFAISPVGCAASAAPVVPEVVVAPVDGPAAAPAATVAVEALPDGALPSGLDGLFPLLWHALGRGTPVPRPALSFQSTTAAEVVKLLRTEPLKTHKVKHTVNEGSLDYVTGEYEHHFVVFKFGSEEDEYRHRLFNAAFTVYYPHAHVAERETTVYKAIVAARGAPTSVAKFRFSDESVSDDLDLHVWDGPELVLTYRAFHDDDDDQDVVVVNFAEAGFYHSRHYWDY